MKLKIKTPYNYMEFDRDDEVNDEPSLTIPDQTLSIPEILERYARGLPIGGANEGYYDEDDDLPDPRTLDLEERFQLAEKYQNEINSINSRKNVINNVDNSVDKISDAEVIDEKS